MNGKDEFSGHSRNLLRKDKMDLRGLWRKQSHGAVNRCGRKTPMNALGKEMQSTGTTYYECGRVWEGGSDGKCAT